MPAPASHLLLSRRHGLSRRALGQCLAWLFLGALGAGQARAGVDPARVPEAKRTRAALYLEAREVPSFIEAQGGAARVLFLDLRTRAEAMYVGMAEAVDALVPFVEHQEFMTDWDAQRNIYRFEPFQDFVPEVHRRLKAKSLTKDDVVVLICRSGDRSSRGANRLGAWA